MRTAIILSLMGLVVLAQDIIDLGTISERLAIVLHAPTNRADFMRFKIELEPLGWTNNFSLSTTNRLLTIEDMRGVPQGPVIMTLWTICSDGWESKPKIYRMPLYREGPDQPSATTTIMSGDVAAAKPVAELRARRRSALARDAQGAPMPGTSGQASAPPMDGGTNKSYADHMVDMKRFHESRSRR